MSDIQALLLEMGEESGGPNLLRSLHSLRDWGHESAEEQPPKAEKTGKRRNEIRNQSWKLRETGGWRISCRSGHKLQFFCFLFVKNLVCRANQ